jgi:hypothetical protein
MPPSIRGDSTYLTESDPGLIKDYLLGAELDSDDLRRIERLYFSDQSVMEQLELVEDELIEQYIRAELSPEDTRRFQEHFLSSPRNQERVRFFQNLQRLVDRPSRKSVALPVLVSKKSLWALAAAGLVLLMIPTAAVVIEERRLGAAIGRLTTSASKLTAEMDGQSATTQKLADQLRRGQEEIQRLEKGQTPASRAGAHAEGNSFAPAALSFLLMPAPLQTRGQAAAEPPRHAIPRSAGAVQLDLVLPRGAAATYVVSINTPDATEVWSSGPLPPVIVGSLHLVRAAVPASVLGNDDYVVNVQSIGGNRQLEPVETYSFRTLVSR